jgi:hypothetical protein
MPFQPPGSHPNDCEDSAEQDEILLQRTVDRLVRFGQQVGVSPEEMILLLDSGISVPDLLAFLEWKGSGAS